ncbi:uncharacterized protein LOC114581139 [Dendrobium catenatum]|uniref:uncharacterized protein LOC114581139 n=1 Tax=Dendrobium catenatum TaxID=906689 RepID=UPI00109F377D|nr:uncharacterized protein LOC114581139 [Dendrobium catenatum]
MRAKFAWNLVLNPNSLLNRILIAKYGNDWWRSDSWRCGSSSWKIIASGWKDLKGFIRWKVVNGRSINVLKDVWILEKCLNKWPTFVAVFEDDNSTLDCFIQEGSWNREKLPLFFGEDLVKLICNIQICQDSESDYMELKRKLSGKSISSMLREENVREVAVVDHNAWIHKVKMNARVKLFIWRLRKDAVPTANFLKKRRLSGCNLCPRGYREVEHVDHITSKCSNLIEVIWKLRRWGFPVPIFSSFQHCLNEIKSVYEDNKLLVKLYFALQWYSWNNRNMKKHRKAEDSVSIIAGNVISFVNMDKLNKDISDYWDAGRSLGQFYDFWCPPPPEWYKINVDAALKNNYEATIGSIVRDCKGRFMLAFGFHGIHWDNSQVELLAFSSLKEVLKDYFFNIKGIIFEGDNKNVILFLQNAN